MPAASVTERRTPPHEARFRCGIDIGGTFTDFVATTPSGTTRATKVLTTYPSPVDGVMAGLAELVAPEGLSAIDHVVHGTTLAANLVLERKGAHTVLLTTMGMRDVLEMRRGNRVLYDLFFKFPPPIVPRDRRLEVNERLLATGEVMRPLEQESIASAWRKAEAIGAQSIAICFLHAYKNPIHERRALQLLRDLGCTLPITLASDISGEMGEFERTSTAVINAYVQPAISAYLRELAERLNGGGFAGDFYMMLSHGGIAPRGTAEQFPVRVIESGPAAGMITVAELAARMNLEHAIGFDMGGTTAKACLVAATGVPLRATFEIAQGQDLERGTGYPLNVPSVDLTEVGAGGGSIAWIDRLGLLQVGPRSAGSSPGPACYPGGGDDPTVTDADLVLGLLNAEYFLGGKILLSQKRADAAVATVARPLGLSQLQAAQAIHDLVNENMCRAVRLHALYRGAELARYALVAFGGAGPVHAGQLAEKLGISTVIVPRLAGVQSAEGLLTAPLSMTVASSFAAPVQNGVAVRVASEITDLRHRALDLIRSGAEHELTSFAQMRYLGQSHYVDVPFDASRLVAEGAAGLRRRFEREYARHFLRTNAQVGVEIVALNVQVTVHTPTLAHTSRAVGRSSPMAVGERMIHLPGSDAFRARVFRRSDLSIGSEIVGPAVIEDVSTTIVVGAGHRTVTDEWGNIVMTVAP